MTQHGHTLDPLALPPRRRKSIRDLRRATHYLG